MIYFRVTAGVLANSNTSFFMRSVPLYLEQCQGSSYLGVIGSALVDSVQWLVQLPISFPNSTVDDVFKGDKSVLFVKKIRPLQK